MNTEPNAAIKNFINSVQVETPLKKSPLPYAYIAGAYEIGDYAKRSEEYRRNFSGKYETPESKSALSNIYQIVDRMIDGYARAVSLAGSDPQFASQKMTWNDSLTKWYKFRNNGSDAGLTELVATILTKPLPSPPPRTSL